MQMPEFESIKPGVTGDFFEYGKVDSLANTIGNWLMNNKDNRETIRQNCYKEIDNNWNPYYQMEVLQKNLFT